MHSLAIAEKNALVARVARALQRGSLRSLGSTQWEAIASRGYDFISPKPEKNIAEKEVAGKTIFRFRMET